MVGTTNQIERIDAVMSAKHIAELEQKITELRSVVGLKQNYIGELARVIARKNGKLSKSHLSTVKEKQLNSKLKRNIEELNSMLNNQSMGWQEMLDTIRSLKQEIKPLVVANDQLYHRCEASDAKLSSCKHLIGRVRSYVDELHDDSCYSFPQYVVGIDDLHAILNENPDVAASDPTIDELNRSHAKLLKAISNEEYTIDTLRAQLKFERNLVDDFRKSISEKNEKIENMEGAIEGDNVELSVRRHDSKVLMDVAALVKNWNNTAPAQLSSHLDMREIYNLLVDYIDVPPVPEIKSAEQNSGTSSIDDDGNSTTVSGPVLEAVRNLFECDENGEDWALFTRDSALEMIDQRNSLAKKEYSQRDKLRRISALLSDDLPHLPLTSRLSLIESIISEDLS